MAVVRASWISSDSISKSTGPLPMEDHEQPLASNEGEIAIAPAKRFAMEG